MKTMLSRVRSASCANIADGIGGGVVDEAVHGDDVIELTEVAVEHVADLEIDAPFAGLGVLCELFLRAQRAPCRRVPATGRWP